MPTVVVSEKVSTETPGGMGSVEKANALRTSIYHCSMLALNGNISIKSWRPGFHHYYKLVVFFSFSGKLQNENSEYLNLTEMLKFDPYETLEIALKSRMFKGRR